MYTNDRARVVLEVCMASVGNKSIRGVYTNVGADGVGGGGIVKFTQSGRRSM